MKKIEGIDENWDYVIGPKSSLFDIRLRELWQYKDLLLLFVRRDIVTLYKQTILGPLWYLIQPLFTTIIFTVIFNNVAGIQTGNTPAFLFNLGGVMVWNYFTSCLNDTSDTFKKNASIFGKVYFPRLIVPLSIVVSNLAKFFIQLAIFVVFYLYFVLQGMKFNLSANVFIFPLLIILMGILGLGMGLIISSLVTKYRDLSFLVSFGVQLLMYVSAVMYPMSLLKEKLPDFGWMIEYNPLAHIIEAARFILFNEGNMSVFGMFYTLFVSIIIFFIGILIFNKTEKRFIDTV